MIKLIRKVWKHTETHTFDFKTLEKTKQSFSALFWLKKASTAGQEQSTPTNHQGLTSPPQPHSFPIKKHMGEEEKEAAKGQHRLPQLPLYDAGFTFCISDITGAKSVKSQQVWLLLGAFKVWNDLPTKKPQQACKDICSRVYTITEGNNEGELEKLNWRLIRKLCS